MGLSRVGKKKKYELELFVSGLTSKSIRTIDTLRAICELHLSEQYQLKIIDIYKEPHLAKENDVFAVPTLIKRAPGRRRVFIGDLTKPDSLYLALGISGRDEKYDK
jgi:circadian clock protein KaiB